MNIAPFIFVGLLATFSMSWFGYVFRPQAEVGRQPQFTNALTGTVYPIARPGLAQQGAEVYRAQGCAACHTQQIRAASEGNDLSRGWGIRRTVAADYMLDQPPQLGNVRLGPDLSNVGLRFSTNDVAWHYQHLLDPKSVPSRIEGVRMEKSNMPPYKYLFHKRRIGSGAPGGIILPSEPEFEYFPKPEAEALVAYLLSLQTEGAVFEAPLPQPPASTNAPAGDTNAPAGATNTPISTNAAAPQ